MFHALKKEEVISQLATEANRGLTEEEAKARLEQYGYNTIIAKKHISALKIFFRQFANFLVIILIIAAIVSYLIGFLPGREPEIENTVLILVIVFFNSVFGFIQEYKAERSIDALKKMSVSTAEVIRNGKPRYIDPKEIVPGDVVVLEEGAKVPADLRLIEVGELAIDESILTGESSPVTKHTEQLSKETPLADRKNMAFMNTLVTRGRGKGVVVATGMATAVGKIAEQIYKAPEKRQPFTIELSRLGKQLAYIIVALIVIIALIQLSTDRIELFTVFLAAVSLGVAAIPEGLPVVVTLAMAFGTRKMVKRKALVRKLSVIESLGSVDVICTDKTGTLTENRMTVTKLYYDGEFYDVTGTGYHTKGEILLRGTPVDNSKLASLLTIGYNCNDAEESCDSETPYIGDPTEIALLVSAKKANITKKLPRVKEEPFSSQTKFMVTVHKHEKGYVAYMKGAPEVILSKCTHIIKNVNPVQLNKQLKKEVLEANETLASQALRVLGFAYKEISSLDEDISSGYCFVGLQGMIDPPRQGVDKSIKVCKRAGISVKMVTGDNLLTAKAIARKIGLGIKAINGPEINKFSDEQLSQVAEETDIFARVTPEHKVRVLNALKRNGHIVAMTGDGVNDAPALKNADVGVGMGLRGSDLAKEVSDMILLDDNFVTIEQAIHEGRTIFTNIRKFVNYLLSSNIGEVLTVFFVSLFGMLAITPVQLLWINLLTDGFPALALGVEPAPPGIMNRKPKKKNEGIISKSLLSSIIITGFVISVLCVALFFIGIKDSLIMAQTLVFTGLVFYELLRLYVIRAREKLGPFSNKWLVLAVIASVGLQLIVLYTPLSRYFKTVALRPFHFLLIITLGLAGAVVIWLLNSILLKEEA